MIKTFNISDPELALSPESLPSDSHTSVIDFFTLFNNILPEKEELLEDLQENFNQNPDFVNNLVAFQAKIIEIHEKLWEDPCKYNISNVKLTVDNLAEIANSDNYEMLDCLTLEVSSQPWIFSPQEELQMADLKKLLDPENLNKATLNNKIVTENNFISETEPRLNVSYESIEFFNSQYIVSHSNISDLSFNNNINLEKYDALTTAVNNQVRDKVIFHNFTSSDTIEIELYPETLGQVKIKCLVEESDRVIVEVSAEKLTTLSILQQNALELKEIIDKNFSSNDSSQLNFQMSQEKNRENNHNNVNDQIYLQSSEETPITTKVHFLHNGIINLIV